LVAPFDFPIQKSTAELETERERIIAQRDPYFLVDEDIALSEQAAFEASFQMQFQGLAADAPFPDLRARPNKYWEAGSKILSDVYAEGIVEEHTALENPMNGIVNIVQDNTISERTPKSFGRTCFFQIHLPINL